MQNKESKFNWKLPVYGAIGFGFGVIIGFFIVFGILDIITHNRIHLTIDNAPLFAAIGAIGGVIGTYVLGLALKDRKKFPYLLYLGAIGFSIGFAIWGIIMITIYEFMSDALMGSAAVAIVWGLLGVIGGGMGGGALGLGLKDKKKFLYLSLTGAIGSGFGAALLSSFGLWGFFIGGATLGLTIEYLTKMENKEPKFNWKLSLCYLVIVFNAGILFLFLISVFAFEGTFFIVLYVISLTINILFMGFLLLYAIIYKKLFYVIGVIFIILLGLFLVSIILQNGVEISKKENETLKKEYPKLEFVPKILIIDGYDLTILVYDNLTRNYQKQTHYGQRNTNAVTALENSIFITTEDSIIRLNAGLEEEKELKLGEIGSLASSNKNIFVSANGSFIALDKDLEKLSSVKLNVTGHPKGKNAHNILIYQNTAYLLDNIIFPVYLFLVNIENPENVQINERIKAVGVSPHLLCQWVNPELDQWLVVIGGGSRGGTYQNLLVYSMLDGKEKAAQGIYRSPDIVKIGEKVEVIKIEDVTQFSPAWGVVSKGDKCYLAEINTENNNISFSNFLDLELKYKYDGKFTIKQFGNYLFIAVEKYLIVVDITQNPKIVLSQEIEGAWRISDFILIDDKFQ